MSVVYPKVGGIVGSPNYIGSFTWATKPSATAVAGAMCYISNVGAGGGGSYWYSDGVRWRAQGGKVTLKGSVGSSATASETLQFVDQTALLPAGLIQNGDTISVRFGALKSSNAATTTSSVYIGASGAVAAGVTTDTIIWALAAPATTNTTMITQAMLERVDATTIRRASVLGGSPYAQAATYPADVTVPSMDTTDMYLSMAYSNSGAETTTGKFCIIELFT